jgi:hypothetical protein
MSKHEAVYGADFTTGGRICGRLWYVSLLSSANKTKMNVRMYSTCNLTSDTMIKIV